MQEKVVYESEWEEVYIAWVEKSKELQSITFRLQKVGQRRIDHIKNEIEDISPETPKMKARDKSQRIEDNLFNISEKAEDLSTLCNLADKGLKDLEERVKAYKSNETIEQKEKGEYNE